MMKNIIHKILQEEYYESRQPVEGYIDADELIGQHLWVHTNRTHMRNGWNGMIGIYPSSRSGRRIDSPLHYTNAVRLSSPIFFQTSESGAERIRKTKTRGLISGVSGIIIKTDEEKGGSGLTPIRYNPFESDVYFVIGDPEKKEIVSADEVFFKADEQGNYTIYARNPQFR